MIPVPAELIHSIARMPLTTGQRLLMCLLAANDGPMDTGELMAGLHCDRRNVFRQTRHLLGRKLISQVTDDRGIITYQLEAVL